MNQPEMPANVFEGDLDLGTILGRNQAFGLIAGRIVEELAQLVNRRQRPHQLSIVLASLQTRLTRLQWQI